MYKVECSLYAICGDGSIGNIRQDKKDFYMDCSLENMQRLINEYLESKKRVAVIESVEKIDGILLLNLKEGI